MIYDYNGAPDPGAARGKFAFPIISNDAICYTAAILKSLFPEIFCYENKRKRSAFDAKQASVIQPDLHCWRYSRPAMA
jgi:hypothetical protein